MTMRERWHRIAGPIHYKNPAAMPRYATLFSHAHLISHPVRRPHSISQLNLLNFSCSS